MLGLPPSPATSLWMSPGVLGFKGGLVFGLGVLDPGYGAACTGHRQREPHQLLWPLGRCVPFAQDPSPPHTWGRASHGHAEPRAGCWRAAAGPAQGALPGLVLLDTPRQSRPQHARPWSWWRRAALALHLLGSREVLRLSGPWRRWWVT